MSRRDELQVRTLARPISRRRFLNDTGRLTLGGLISSATVLRLSAAGPGADFSPADLALLDELVQAGFRYFWEAAHPRTGLVKDRSRADGPDERTIASIAATGFGLTALCIADARGLGDRKQIRERVRTTLRYFREQAEHQRGFFYHFIHWETGAREWKCELSSIDTALLLAGVLACRQHFADREIRELARKIYERVDWQWMMNDGPTLAMAWYPERGFLPNRWKAYCEHNLLYLLALGSPTHPIPAAAWEAWDRPLHEYEGRRYLGSDAPLFVHQFSHAWFDFRGHRDRHADYFENSVTATKVHQRFCSQLRARFPKFGEDLWGITASDSAHGYTAWGGPPEMGRLDGSIVPCAAAGSLPFLPHEALHTLHFMRQQFGDKIWKRYGFVDAFNPHNGWVNPDVIGIDVGISMLMAENARSGFVWKTFMKNPEAGRAMRRAGFASAPPK